jgi:hypothetical protein
MTNLHVLPESKQRYEVKVDLDDRAFLFPSGKPVIQLAFVAEGRHIHVDALYPFNQTHTPPRIFSLGLEDARELGRRLVEAVHTARTQLVVSDSVRITINVIANGYHLQIGDMNQPIEIFLGTGCIWRVCQALLRTIDYIAPVESN